MTAEGPVRPKVVAVLARDDYGPCDPEPRAHCPHCGAPGRYVFTALMSDGGTKRMMAGCLASYASHPAAKDCADALAKEAEAAKSGRKVAHWWGHVLKAIGDLRACPSGTPEAAAKLKALETACRTMRLRRRAYMQSRGWRR